MILSSLFRSSSSAGEIRSIENPSITIAEAFEAAYGSFATDSGETMDISKSLTLSPVWCAVKMISGDGSKLPIEIYQRDGEDRSADYDHPWYDRLHNLGMANSQTTSLEFWRAYWESALLWENAYAWIDRRRTELHFLLPTHTEVVSHRGTKWVLNYSIDDDEFRKPHVLPYSDVLHVKGLSLGDFHGRQLVLQAREDFANAIKSRRFKSKFLKNNMKAGGILMAPPGTSKKNRDNLEKGITERSQNDDNDFRTLVLRDGYKWIATQVKPSEAQLGDIDEAEIRNVARWFCMWPGRLGVRDSISYNSISEERRDYHDTTLSYWLLPIKSQLQTKILTEEDRLRRRRFIDFKISALNWANPTDTANIGRMFVDSRIAVPNEVRRWFNMPPMDGGNELKPLKGSPAAAGSTEAEPAAEPDAEASRSSPTLNQHQRQAIADNIADALTRVRTRLTQQATRAAANPPRFTEWLEGLEQHNREICGRMVAPAVAVARSVGMLDDSTDPVDAWLATFRSGLDQIADTATRDELATAVAGYVEQFEFKLPIR